MIKKNKIPTVIAIVLLVIGVAAGVFLVNQRQIFKIGADPDISPQDIRVTNLSDASFTVSWITDKDTIGYLEWGEGKDTSKTQSEEKSEASAIHYVTLRNLNASETYSFKINSNGSKFDNSGIPWQIQTGPKLLPSTDTSVISGKILTSTGAPASEVLIYLTTGGIAPISTKTSTNGTFVLPLSLARNSILTDHAAINPEKTVLDVFIQGGRLGVATAQTYQMTANPLPDITLGKSYDFKDESVSTSGENPEANINLPIETTEPTATPAATTAAIANTGTNRFVVDENASQDKTTKDVTLESIDSGETVYTDVPEFFGEGPTDAQITITVESDNPISDQFYVDSTGDWKWSPPTGLAEGEHTVTINWVDSDGVLRSLVRTFSVDASSNDEPAFESTPSGSTPTPTPTKSPSPTPKPTVSPSPTATAKPTASPTPTPTKTPTPAPLPDAGIGTPTLIGVSAGILLVIGAILIAL